MPRLSQFLWVPILLLLLRVLVAYGGVTFTYEGMLRDSYEAQAQALAVEAEARLTTEEAQDVARWAVAARNELKVETREAGNPITEQLAEDRNLEHYGDPVGPSYELLAADLLAEGVDPAAIDLEIIAGAARTNSGVNSAANLLLFGGIGLLIGYVAAVAVALSRSEPQRRTMLLLQESIGFAAAIGGASIGVALLAPINLLTQTSLDTIFLGVCGVLLGVPCVSFGRSMVKRHRVEG